MSSFSRSQISEEESSTNVWFDYIKLLELFWFCTRFNRLFPTSTGCHRLRGKTKVWKYRISDLRELHFSISHSHLCSRLSIFVIAIVFPIKLYVHLLRLAFKLVKRQKRARFIICSASPTYAYDDDERSRNFFMNEKILLWILIFFSWMNFKQMCARRQWDEVKPFEFF